MIISAGDTLFVVEGKGAIIRALREIVLGGQGKHSVLVLGLVQGSVDPLRCI